MSTAIVPSAPLELVAELPAMPLIVVSHDAISRIESFQEQVKALRIATPEDAQRASDLLASCSTLARMIETRRSEAKKPFIDMGKRIDEAAKPHASTLTQLIDAMRTKLNAWQAEQERIAREAEAKRQAELARLEREKKAAQEAAAKAAAAAQAAPIADDLADLDAIESADTVRHITESQANLAVARQVVTKPAGVSYRTILKPEVTDVHALPSKYVIVSANLEAVRRDHCTGWKSGDPLPCVPGIRFIVDKTPIVNTRR